MYPGNNNFCNYDGDSDSFGDGELYDGEAEGHPKWKDTWENHDMIGESTHATATENNDECKLNVFVETVLHAGELQNTTTEFEIVEKDVLNNGGVAAKQVATQHASQPASQHASQPASQHASQHASQPGKKKVRNSKKAADAAEKAAEKQAEIAKNLIAKAEEITGTEAASQLPKQAPKFACPETYNGKWIYILYCIFLRGSLLSEYAYTWMDAYKGPPNSRKEDGEKLKDQIELISAAILAAAEDDDLTEYMRKQYATSPSEMPNKTASSQKLAIATSKCLTEVLRLLHGILVIINEIPESKEAETKAEHLLFSGILGPALTELLTLMQFSMGQGQHGMSKKVTEFEIRWLFKKLVHSESGALEKKKLAGLLFACSPEDMQLRGDKIQIPQGSFDKNVHFCHVNGVNPRLPCYVCESLQVEGPLAPTEVSPKHTKLKTLKSTMLPVNMVNILPLIGINLIPCNNVCCSMSNYTLDCSFEIIPDMLWEPDKRDCKIWCLRFIVVKPLVAVPTHTMRTIQMAAGRLPCVKAFNSQGLLRPLFTLEQPGTRKDKPRRGIQVALDGGRGVKRQKTNSTLAVTGADPTLAVTDAAPAEEQPKKQKLQCVEHPRDEDTTSRTELPSAPAADPQSTECIEDQLLQYFEANITGVNVPVFFK